MIQNPKSSTERCTPSSRSDDNDSTALSASIASLRAEISGLEEARQKATASLAGVDVTSLAADVDDANEIALRRAFSWTRFLSRLEKTLPADLRISSIGLQKMTGSSGSAAPERRAPSETVLVALTLISRDPNGLPKTIRAFDSSKWFDHPTPASEDRGEKGLPEGRRLVLSVEYHDVEGRTEGHR